MKNTMDMTVFRHLMLIFGIAVPAVLLLTVLLCHRIIPVLRAHRIGQHIFTEAVGQHAGKEGTPTMGGICFIIPMLLVVLGFFLYGVLNGNTRLIAPALAVALGVANAMIGFIDDYTKLCHKENQGLTTLQKLLLQIFVAALYVWGMAATGQMETTLSLPSLGLSWNMGMLYYALAVIVIVGMVNATNLTDGIDGLASSVALVCAMCLTAIGFVLSDENTVLLSALLIGGMIGFLLFNFHPAKVFMGDTGSLYLGGLLIGIGFMVGRPWIVVILSMVFVLDMLSSLIQIVSIRVFHRKVFRIAPVHHQFQLMGWSEEKIVYVFTAVGLLFGLLAVAMVVFTPV